MIFLIPIIAIAILIWAIDAIYFAKIPTNENNQSIIEHQDEFEIQKEYIENYISK